MIMCFHTQTDAFKPWASLVLPSWSQEDPWQYKLKVSIWEETFSHTQSSI